MNHDLLRQDERNLVAAARRGAMPASGQIVERYQGDLTRAAYLLTGDRAEALALVARAFRKAFQELRRIDPDAPLRPWLFARLIEASRTEGDDWGGWAQPAATLPAAGPARYQVDDERSRLRAALALLDEDARAALVLSDLAGLTNAEVAAATGRKPEEVPGLLQAARDRLRAAGGLADDRPPGVALSEAAVDAPRADLWPLLEDPVTVIHERERFRARALTLGAVAVVAALVFGTLALLVFGAVSNGGGDSAAVAPTATLAVAPTLPAATPTPTVPYVPDGEVPDAMLVSSDFQSGGGVARRDLLLNLVSGEPVDLPNGTVAGISRDGSLLLILDERPPSLTGGLSLIGVSTRSFEEVWRVDLREAVPAGNASISYDVAVGGASAYIALYDPEQHAGPLILAIVDLATGDLVSSLEIDPELDPASQASDVHLYLARDESRLTIVFDIRTAGQARVMQVMLQAGAAGVRPVSSGSRLASLEGMDLERAMLFPDGSGLYEPPGGLVGNDPAMSVLLFDTLRRSRLPLPFTGSAPVLESTFSHDGRWLYVISPFDRQVAIVDLERRQVERLILLDVGGIEVARPEDLGIPLSNNLYDGVTAQISPDGRYLYAASSAHLGEGVVAAGIWKIDTATWTVVDEFLVDTIAPLESIHLNADGATLYARLAMSGLGRDSNRRFGYLLAVDAATGDLLDTGDQGSAGFSVRGTLADLYRRQHGRSPAVAGVTPADNPEFTSLPLIEVAITPEQIEPGGDVAVEVRILNPDGLEEMTGEHAAVRFDPNSTITATFGGGGERQVLVLARERFGYYTGRIAVPEPGRWDLTVTVSPPGGTGWSIEYPGVLDVGHLFTGTDRRAYGIQIATIPPVPVGGSWVEFVAGFTDVETGAPMPAGVTLEDGMPAEMQLTLGDGQVFPLFRGGHAAYGSFVFFPVPGNHLVELSWTAPETGEHRTAVAGPVRVIEDR